MTATPAPTPRAALTELLAALRAWDECDDECLAVHWWRLRWGLPIGEPGHVRRLHAALVAAERALGGGD